MSAAADTANGASSDPPWAQLLPARRTTYRVVRGRVVAMRLNPAVQPVDPQFGARVIAGLRSLGDPAATRAADDPARMHPVVSPGHRVTAGGENDPFVPPGTS